MSPGDKTLGGFYSDCSIAAIRISADRFGEFLVQRCPADQHNVIVSDTQLLFLSWL